MSKRQPFSLRMADAVAVWLGHVLPVPLRRVAYRIGFSVMSVVWAITRPHGHGVKVAVVRDDSSVLLVRHTYGRPYWDVPGGLCRGGEEPVASARRELLEETGLSGPLEPLGSWETVERRRPGRVTAFTLAVGDDATVKIDAAEIAVARWWPLDRLPPHRSAICHVVLNAVRGDRAPANQVEDGSRS